MIFDESQDGNISEPDSDLDIELMQEDPYTTTTYSTRTTFRKPLRSNGIARASVKTPLKRLGSMRVLNARDSFQSICCPEDENSISFSDTRDSSQNNCCLEDDTSVSFKKNAIVVVGIASILRNRTARDGLADKDDFPDITTELNDLPPLDTCSKPNIPKRVLLQKQALQLRLDMQEASKPILLLERGEKAKVKIPLLKKSKKAQVTLHTEGLTAEAKMTSSIKSDVQFEPVKQNQETPILVQSMEWPQHPAKECFGDNATACCSSRHKNFRRRRFVRA